MCWKGLGNYMKEFDKYFNISVLHKAPDDPRVFDHGSNITEIRHYETTLKEVDSILNSLETSEGIGGSRLVDLLIWYEKNYIDIIRLNNGLPDKDRFNEKVIVPLDDTASVCVKGAWKDRERFSATSYLQLKREDKTEVLQLEVVQKYSNYLVVDYFKNDKACYRAMPEFGGLNNLSISCIEAIRDDLKLIEKYKDKIVQEVVQHQSMIEGYLSAIRGR